MPRTFEEWKRLVNELIENHCGLGADDLEDQPYYRWYEEGLTVYEAAAHALKNNGFPV